MNHMTAVNVIKVQKGRAKEVADRFAKPKAVHTFPGFVRMEVWMKETDEAHDELHICTTWEEEADFIHWRDSRVNANVHAKGASKEERPESSPIIEANVSTFTTLYQHLPSHD